jgi:hypothetical protein
MGIGVGIFLLAVGAVLALAVHINPTGGAVDLHTIGWILMGVGALGVALSMAFWSSWAGPGRLTRRTTDVGPLARHARRPSIRLRASGDR